MMIAGLETPTKGGVFVGGAPMQKPREDIGLMFQDSTLLPWKSSIENVMFPIRILRRDRKEYEEKAKELLKRVGLDQFLDKKPAQLSGGMRQRVAICRALIYDPDVLLMDEPFSALDAITRDEMNQVLMNLWQDFKKTGLFVTHSIREDSFSLDRVLVMSARPGTIIEDLEVPFPRPRDFSWSRHQNLTKFGYLRGKIDAQH